jgi:hypothetical protein
MARTRATPNQVTFVSIGVFMCAAAALALLPGALGLWLGVALVELSYIFDCADGQLARVTGRSSSVGALLDFLMDELKAYLLIAAVAARVPGCPPAPNFANDVQLYTVLMLCTSVGTVRDPAALNGLLVQHPLPGAAAAAVSLADRRRDHELRLDEAAMRSAALWVAFLTGCWRTQLAEALATIVGAKEGGSLVRVVSAHSLHVYSARRRLLRGVPDFAERPRDPAPVARSRL